MVYSEDCSLIFFVNRGRYKTTDSLMTFRFPCGSLQLERILTEVQGPLMAASCESTAGGCRRREDLHHFVHPWVELSYGECLFQIW
jgi:hypothetical protein